MRIYSTLIIIFSTLILTSCTSLSSEQSTPQNSSQSWGSRAQTLSKINSWDLKGLISIRNNAKPDNLTANVQWQQQQQQYSILFFGPLGAGSAKLTGTPGNVQLQTADGKTYTSTSAENLLAEQTHWTLPVSSLFYWIRGIPVPNIPAKKTFDSFNHLTELEQQGWKIQFLRYTSAHQIDIPNKIFLFSPDFNVKIIINEWKL